MCQHMAHIEPRWEADRERPASAWYAGQYATYTNATPDTRAIPAPPPTRSMMIDTSHFQWTREDTIGPIPQD